MHVKGRSGLKSDSKRASCPIEEPNVFFSNGPISGPIFVFASEISMLFNTDCEALYFRRLDHSRLENTIDISIEKKYKKLSVFD